jgi:hypothetical protein
MKTLIAFVLFLGVTFCNKRWKLGIEPTTIAASLAAVVGILRMFPSQPLTPRARKVAVVLIGISSALAVGIQVYPQKVVEIMRYVPADIDTATPDASNVPAPPVASGVVGGTTETPAPAGTLPVAPDAATPEVVEPPALHLPDTSSLPSVLVIGCLVPALGTFSRRARRGLLAVALAIGLSGCMCSLCPSVKADAAQGARGACWTVESLARSCTLPDGTALTPPECALRVERAELYMSRHQVDCSTIAL